MSKNIIPIKISKQDLLQNGFSLSETQTFARCGLCDVDLTALGAKISFIKTFDDFSTIQNILKYFGVCKPHSEDNHIIKLNTNSFPDFSNNVLETSNGELYLKYENVIFKNIQKKQMLVKFSKTTGLSFLFYSEEISKKHILLLHSIRFSYYFTKTIIETTFKEKYQNTLSQKVHALIPFKSYEIKYLKKHNEYINVNITFSYQSRNRGHTVYSANKSKYEKCLDKTWKNKIDENTTRTRYINSYADAEEIKQGETIILYRTTEKTKHINSFKKYITNKKILEKLNFENFDLGDFERK